MSGKGFFLFGCWREGRRAGGRAGGGGTVGGGVDVRMMRINADARAIGG